MIFIAWGGNNVYEHISSIVFLPALLLWQRRRRCHPYATGSADDSGRLNLTDLLLFTLSGDGRSLKDGGVVTKLVAGDTLSSLSHIAKILSKRAR